MGRQSTAAGSAKLAPAVTAEAAIRRTVLAIPVARVATYGQVAEAAGFPRYHRQVAQVLRKYGEALPWHRVLGAGGFIKQAAHGALEQRMRLELEGVRFRGRRVDMSTHQHLFEKVISSTRTASPRPTRGSRKA